LNETEMKEWLLSHNFLEAMRVAVHELRNSDLAPFYDLTTEGKATVTITMDAANNIYFQKYASPLPSEPIVLMEPTPAEPEEPPATEEPKTTTRRIKPRQIEADF